ncbi:unnamed protein product [Lasius platythorax]|uniref:Uncharacterized protein n=1 Tax=Lasius platythorax TaxID=488582 RepID=A0AAV2P5R5_9HYME
MMEVLERQSVETGTTNNSFLSDQTTGSGFTVLVTCDLLSPAGQRHCTGSKEVWCHFNDLRLVPRSLRVRGQTGYQYACEYLRSIERREETHTPCANPRQGRPCRDHRVSIYVLELRTRVCVLFTIDIRCVCDADN